MIDLEKQEVERLKARLYDIGKEQKHHKRRFIDLELERLRILKKLQAKETGEDINKDTAVLDLDGPTLDDIKALDNIKALDAREESKQ